MKEVSPKMNKMKRNDKGLTLIEVLIVVSVLLVLSALIVVGVRAAKEASSTAQCGKNLHQIYLALRMYEEENGGPFLRGPMTQVFPELKGQTLCPKDPTRGTQTRGGHPIPQESPFNLCLGSYSLGTYYIDRWIIRRPTPWDRSDVYLTECVWHTNGEIWPEGRKVGARGWEVSLAVYYDGSVRWRREDPCSGWYAELCERLRRSERPQNGTFRNTAETGGR
jgi:prepilin-type N-terminal cleavage/methylation domain-containing protein